MQIVAKTLDVESSDTIGDTKIEDNEEYAPSPSVTVTADTLAHALDKMGLTESVSATLLYDTILQVQSAQSSQPPPQITQSPVPQNQMAKADYPKGCRNIIWAGPFNQPIDLTMKPGPDFFDPVRVEKRRKLREMMKADFPNGIPEETRVGYLPMRVVNVREQGR